LKRGVTVAQVNDAVSEGLLTREDIQRAVSARTLSRRKTDMGTVLKRQEPDALLRLLRVRVHALRVFEDPEAATEWLDLPNPALGDEQPIEMAETDTGAREVEAVLGRIEHGVFS
jgi:putative toxin-antitoxin system antitoxin component (TIGR02293 family)